MAFVGEGEAAWDSSCEGTARCGSAGVWNLWTQVQTECSWCLPWHTITSELLLLCWCCGCNLLQGEQILQLGCRAERKGVIFPSTRHFPFWDGSEARSHSPSLALHSWAGGGLRAAASATETSPARKPRGSFHFKMKGELTRAVRTGLGCGSFFLLPHYRVVSNLCVKRKGTWGVSTKIGGVEEEARRSHGERWEAKRCWGEEGRLRACVCWGCELVASFCPSTAPALSFVGVRIPPGQAARS